MRDLPEFDAGILEEPAREARDEERNPDENEREVGDDAGEPDAARERDHERPDAAVVSGGAVLGVSRSVFVRHEKPFARSARRLRYVMKVASRFRSGRKVFIETRF